MMIAQDIANRVRYLTNDETGVRWADPEMLAWINDGQMVIVANRPDAASSVAEFTLVAGSKQTIPSDGLRLLDITRNIGAGGAAGRVIKFTDRRNLDTQIPDWHSVAGADSIKHYVYDNRAPRVFYVYPPANSGIKVEGMYSIAPTEITSMSASLTVPDIYRDALVNYVMFRCYCKDTEARHDLAQMYLGALNQGLGIKLQRDVALQPQLYNKSANDNAAALSSGGV